MLIWAANPSMDDPPPPIAIWDKGDPNVAKHVVGWTLEFVAIVEEIDACRYHRHPCQRIHWTVLTEEA